MRKFIKTVTVTGADDSIQPEDLFPITREFPFVEWGILFSKSSEGRARFPSQDWVAGLQDMVLGTDDFHERDESKDPTPKLSAHICGRWVRDLCAGNPTIIQEIASLGVFERIQLNFHAYVHRIENRARFVRGLALIEGYRIGKAEMLAWSKGHTQFIFQLDNVNDGTATEATVAGIDAMGLFDLSGGAGTLPGQWPRQNTNMGYAGGLSPDNVAEQLEKIEQVAGSVAWIDAETHLRSADDTQFDLDKVRSFLEAAKPWVITD